MPENINFIEIKNFRSLLEIPKAPINVYDAEYLSGQTFNKLISSELAGTRYAVTKAGKMNMKITIDSLDECTYGALLYFFEMATAAAGEFLNIDAFNQPGVEDGKIATFALMGREGYEDMAKEMNRTAPEEAGYIYKF